MNNPTKRQIIHPSRLSLSLLTGLFSILLAFSAAAATLDSAKSSGLIGEMPTGYLGLVNKSAPQDVKELVTEVNEKRRERYAQIAKQQGAPLDEVEKVGGQTAIDKTEPGNYVMDGAGRWVKK